MGVEGGSVRTACKEIKKKQKEVVWGQCWLPVCLWNTSQLALTVNAGKTKFPKLGGGLRGGGRKVVMVVEGGEIAVKMACMWMVGLMMGLGGGGGVIRA